MRTALIIVFLILAVGGVMAVFSAEDAFERRYDAAACLAGVGGLMVMARLLRRKLGEAEYKRVMGFTPEATAGILKFVGLVIAAPVLVYWIVTGHVSVEWDAGEGLLAGALGVAGLIAWGISTRL